MERRIVLWAVIGALFLIAVFFAFKLGSSGTGASISELNAKIDTTGWTENEIMNYEMHGTIPSRVGKASTSAGSSGGMVRGC